MKKLAPFVLSAFMVMPLFSQVEFSAEEYMQFIEENRNLTTADLLQQNPPKTIYYASRRHQPDLSDIPWYDSVNSCFSFTGDEQELLKNNFFMVTERMKHLTWHDAFISVYNRDLPLFLSTDFILFTLHQSYDEILKTLEYRLLEPNLSELLEAMYNSFPTLVATYDEHPGILASLQDVDLFVAVARTLLEEAGFPPQLAEPEQYHAILGAIENEEMVSMPLFTGDTISRKIDFSQFKPRGHYTDIIYAPGGQVTLEKYFRAMTWLGRIDFFLTDPPEKGMEGMWNPDELVRMNISALLLNELLHTCGKKELFDTHEKIITYLVGESDNLTPYELKDLSDIHLDSPLDLLDPDTFSDFRELLASSDDYGQKIMSNFFYVDVAEKNPAEMPVSFRLLGQKFILDSYIFHHVVYDRIIYEDKAVWRPLPDPLDMLSVLGNENAMALMEGEMEEFHYAYKVNELKYLVDAYDDSFWENSLYNSWLSAIRDLNPPVSANGLPFFMQTTAWHHEKLNTQLTSWAQLRHDNILYAKQSYTGGTSCSYPYTFVEPYPGFYHRLEKYAGDAGQFYTGLLQELDPELSAMIGQYYNRYAEIMAMLEGIASKELAKRPLSENELVFLKTMINEYMASGPSISGWLNDLYFPAWSQYDFDFTVADVHTQPTDRGGAPVGNVLHVGNGMINMGVFIAPSTVKPGQSICYAGPVSSFHLEVKPGFYRYNDEEWEASFMEGKEPPRPDWVYHYLADENGNHNPPENTLKGVEYAGIFSVPSATWDPGYLLLYPNPVEGQLHLRFITEKEMKVGAMVCDLAGRRISELPSKDLPPAEHDLTLETSNLRPGIYILRLNAGNSVISRKFVVQ